MEIDRLTLEEIIELIDHCLLEGGEPEMALRTIRRRVAAALGWGDQYDGPEGGFRKPGEPGPGEWGDASDAT